MTLFEHLDKRLSDLLCKFIVPIVEAEDEALANSIQLPTPDYDSIAAFRLLAHAELERYFEQKALSAVDKLDNMIKAGKSITHDIAALISLYLWKSKHIFDWSSVTTSRQYFNVNAQNALGFARDIIKKNNGIKEDSISVLSAIMGYFEDELDNVLISELNQYGKLRGEVAHDSWTFNTRTFDAAVIEQNRVKDILRLIREFYER
jgi:hypothetical protein